MKLFSKLNRMNRKKQIGQTVNYNCGGHRLENKPV